MRSPASKRRWRLVATSGVGTTRSAVPRLMATLGGSGHVEEGAASRCDGLQRNDVVLDDVSRQLRVVEIDRVLLAIGDQPVEEVDQRGPFGLVGLVFVEHYPAVSADRRAGLAGGVHDRELGRADREGLACSRRSPRGGGAGGA